MNTFYINREANMDGSTSITSSYASANVILPLKLKPYPMEFHKLVAAVFIAFTGAVLSCLSMVIVNEYYPDTEPLPDFILDLIPYEPYGMYVSDIIVLIQSFATVLLLLFHKYRCIVLRRFFLIVGLLFVYRGLMTFLKISPVADVTTECEPRMMEAHEALSVLIVAKKVFYLLLGFGIGLNGKIHYCGSFVLSGHAIAFVTNYLAIYEYTPKRFFMLQWANWMFTMYGISFLLIGRGQYSVDVVLTYFIATRLWYIYHTSCYHEALKWPSKINLPSSIWWWHIFRWFEVNVTTGPLPNRFSLPLPRPWRKCLEHLWSDTKQCCCKSQSFQD